MKLLFVSGVSACFELDNDAPYYAPESYTVWLDGEPQFEGNANVFSLFSLRPGAHYQVAVTTAQGLEERFRAAGDGVTDDTAAIQAAIHCLPEGGLLHFPAGRYLTAPLALKSHITLSLGEGAVLLGTPQRSRIP